jgi:chromosome segregation ATPase
MRDICKAPSRADSGRTQVLQEENIKLSQQATALSTQLKQSQNDVQALQKKNQILLTQINQLQQQPSTSNTSLEQYKQRIADLEQKLTKTEETVTRYADPDIRKLHVEMGFPLNLAREALVNNKSVADAIQWLLENSHRSAQPPKV